MVTVTEKNLAMEHEDGGWSTVEGRKAKGGSRSTVRREDNRQAGSQRKIWFDLGKSDRIVSFFFTRFPEDWNEESLWKMFQRYGPVIDVFIARKLTRRGTRFGFARFNKSGDVRSLEKRLKTIMIGDKPLIINVAKFSRNENDLHGWKPDGVKMKVEKGVEHGRMRDKRSFKEAVMGFSDAEKKEVRKENVIKLKESEDMAEKLRRCWIGEARNIDILRNVWKIMENEGVPSEKIQHAGGVSILVEWNSKEEAENKLVSMKVKLNTWIKDLRMWSPNRSITGRLAWIEIDGIPIQARGRDAYILVADEFGEVLDVDEVDNDSLSLQNPEVLILSRSCRQINSSTLVSVGDWEFNVKVSEDSNRAFLISPPVDSVDDNWDGNSSDEGSVGSELAPKTMGDEDDDDFFVADSFAEYELVAVEDELVAVEGEEGNQSPTGEHGILCQENDGDERIKNRYPMADGEVEAAGVFSRPDISNKIVDIGSIKSDVMLGLEKKKGIGPKIRSCMLPKSECWA